MSRSSHSAEVHDCSQRHGDEPGASSEPKPRGPRQNTWCTWLYLERSVSARQNGSNSWSQKTADCSRRRRQRGCWCRGCISSPGLAFPTAVLDRLDAAYWGIGENLVVKLALGANSRSDSAWPAALRRGAQVTLPFAAGAAVCRPLRSLPWETQA